MRFASVFLIASTSFAVAEPVKYSELTNDFWRGNFGNVIECLQHQIGKDVIRMREAGVLDPEEEIYVDDDVDGFPIGAVEVTFADTDSNYSCVPQEGSSTVSLISIEMGEVFTICKKWSPGCDNM